MHGRCAGSPVVASGVTIPLVFRNGRGAVTGDHSFSVLKWITGIIYIALLLGFSRNEKNKELLNSNDEPSSLMIRRRSSIPFVSNSVHTNLKTWYPFCLKRSHLHCKK